MANVLSPIGGAAAQFFNNNGIPVAGGLIYTYAAGTNTPAATYTNQNGTIANSNPIVLDASGRPPQEIWLAQNQSYKFVLTDASNNQIWSYDNIVGINSNFIAYSAQEQVVIATSGQTVVNMTSISYQPATGSLIVFVDGLKQISGTNYAETSSTSITFTTGLHAGAIVDMTTAVSLSSNATLASNVSYNEGGTGAVNRTVQTKLQEVVSIKDFGAVGDGITDDSSAINAAINYVGSLGGGSVYIPPGNYGITRVFIKYSNVTLYGEGTASSLIQVGNPPANYPSNPNGTSIFSNPNAAITIAPPGFIWGDNQDPNTSTVGTVSSVTLKDFKLTGWWASPPPPYTGFNTNITGQNINDRSGGIFALCTTEIRYENLNISQMGAENSYSWNTYISNCWITGGGETGSLGEYGNVVNCRVQSSYSENGVSARYINGNMIFGMQQSGILIGGSSIGSGGIVSNNYVFNCGSFPIIATDDGAFTVPKVDFIFENNVLIGNTSQTIGNSVLFIDYRAAGSTFQINNNFITGIDGTIVTTGLYFGPCQGNAYVNNNIIMGTGSGVSNGISTSATSGFEIYMEGNNISGVLHPVDTTNPVTLYSKGMNFVGNTVFNGANTLISPAIDNLVVNENIIYNTSGDLVSSPATTYSPVSSQRMKQCQFTGSSLTVNPPSGYQPGQLFVLEIFNASGSAATVTMNSGTVPAAYKGSLTSGVSLNNAQRVIVQMVYITNTWLELSKAVI